MIRSLVGWIISMIRRQNQQIVLTEQRQKLSQLLSNFSISSPYPTGFLRCPHNASKSTRLVKQSPFEIPLCDIDGLLHAMHAAVGMIAFCYPFSHKDIVNLSNRNHIISGILQGIQRRSIRWVSKHNHGDYLSV